MERKSEWMNAKSLDIRHRRWNKDWVNGNKYKTERQKTNTKQEMKQRSNKREKIPTKNTLNRRSNKYTLKKKKKRNRNQNKYQINEKKYTSEKKKQKK